LKLVRIRQVKKEIRVLGLAASPLDGSHVVVGVVYRGRLGMDGVLCCSSSSPDLTVATASMIRGSAHFNQIRVIAVDMDRLPPGAGVELDTLASGTGKPVLGLTRAGGELDERFMFLWRGHTVTSMGLERGDAEMVLETCSVEGYPEALRVASLVAEEFSGTGLHKV
jgi:endonuclease V-like protein UPF0215 family